MRLNPTQKQILSGLIERELEMSRRMLELLEREHQTLSDVNPEAINAISSEKVELMRHLEQQIKKRNSFLLELGLDTGTSGVETAITNAGPDTQLQSYWDEMRSVAAQLQQKNEVNGGIISAGQRRAKQALDILCGKEALSGTYSQEGETQFSKSNNLHTKA